MTEPPNAPFLRHIRHLLGGVPAAALTDGQLLERFLADRDETAVEVLVRRYGPLVLGVCRRVLRNAHAAEDAFQAVFLVLLRKAPSLVRYERLGGWLYRVAYRLALRARANETQRQRWEAQAARRRPPAEGPAPRPADLVIALEEELQKLPEKHRAPLVLCYLEGKTNEQAAAVLGCPRGSMSARLTQARERLRVCLARRGYAVPAAGLASLLATAAAEAAVPLPLLSSTVRAALWFAGEDAGTAGCVSTQAVALARGAFRAMFVNQLKLAGTVLLAAAMLGTGATLLLRAAPQTCPPAQAVEQTPPKARPDRPEIPGERLPQGALARMGTTQLRHGDAIFFAAYTPTGSSLLTAGKDRTVRLWDLATGQERRRFRWPEVQPEPSEDGAVQKLQQQQWDDRALSSQAALSADGKVAAASRGGVVCLWETARGQPLRQLQTGQKRLVQLAFSADGKSLLTLGPGGEAAIWETATGRCVRRSQGKVGGGHGINDQNALASPGWKYLAYLRRDAAERRVIHLRDLATGKELGHIDAGQFGMPQPLCFSADDKVLVWEDNPAGGLVFSDAATGKELRRLGYYRRRDGDGPFDAALAIALSADGRSLAVCRMSHTIDLWELASSRQTHPVGKATDAQRELRVTDQVGALVRPALAFSPDGKKLVCSLGGETVRQFRADTGAEILGSGQGHRWPVSTLALSADGRSLYSYGHGDPVHVWDWATGKETGQRGVPGDATHAVFAADGRLGFAAGYTFTRRGPDGQQTWKIDEPPVSLALSPAGDLVAMRIWPRPEVHLRDAATGKERHTLGQAGERRALATSLVTEMTGVVPAHLVFSPNGCYLAGAGPTRQLCLWDVATGQLLWQLAPEAGPAIERFAFSANSLCLATVNADQTATLYEVVTGAKRGRLGEADPNPRTPHLTDGGMQDFLQMRRDLPICLAFSPDGRYLATAQETPDIHLWDVIASREVGRLKGHQGGVVSLLFTPDGKHLVSGGTDTTVLTWDVTQLTSARRGSLGAAARLRPQVLDALWTDLGGKDATQAFDAIRRLSAAPEQAVTLLRERVRPATPADPKRLAQVLADLESDRFELRRQAESELQELGDLAEPALRRAVADDPPLDLRQRGERLLAKLLVPTAGQLRDLRAVELLELIGSAAARRLLQVLAGGVPGARLTREASSALQRLTRQAVTP